MVQDRDRLVRLGDETWFNPKDVASNGKTWDPRIKLLENKFAFFNGLEDLTFTATEGSDNMDPGESYTLKDAPSTSLVRGPPGGTPSTRESARILPIPIQRMCMYMREK